MDGDIDGFINAYLTANATGALKKETADPTEVERGRRPVPGGGLCFERELSYLWSTLYMCSMRSSTLLE